jgi:Helicase conserved C-terminal domain
MKKTALLAIVLFASTVPGLAQITVIDPASIKQQIQQLLQMQKELVQLQQMCETPIELATHDLEERDRRRLQEFTRRAESLKSDEDPKIKRAADIISNLISTGFRPIVYCRFIPTAHYVSEELNRLLPKRFSDFRAIAVTGESGSDEERKALIDDLVQHEPKCLNRVLVATDCLSEGINLQDNFDAVLHYDLPWNPNRLEQREGRIDRYGQARSEVKAVLLYSPDNVVDGVVLNVLLRKAREIYKVLGVNVPVPVNSETVMKAVINAVFESKDPLQLRLDLGEINSVPKLHAEWDIAGERERISRSRFAQHAINPIEVEKQLRVTDDVLGDPDTVQTFLTDAADRLDFSLTHRKDHVVLTLGENLRPMADQLGWKKEQHIVFDSQQPLLKEQTEVVLRNHPLVLAVSNRILSEAFSPEPNRKFARCGAAYTAAVKTRTAIVLLRIRYRLTARRRKNEQFAEEVVTCSLYRNGNGPKWSEPNNLDTLRLLQLNLSDTKGQISQQERTDQVLWALRAIDKTKNDLDQLVKQRAMELELTHSRLRKQIGGAQVAFTPYSPDILGLYVLLPAASR